MFDTLMKEQMFPTLLESVIEKEDDYIKDRLGKGILNEPYR